MIQAIKEGVDVHAYTASLMFGMPIDFVKEENKLVGHTTNPEEIQRILYAHPEIKDRIAGNWPRTMSLRQCGKKSNHGLNYDEGYKNFALINSIEEREARRIVEMYHSIYPGIRIMYDAIKRQLQKDRTLTNCFGRKIFFMEDWCKDMWKSAYACLPQSTVVDCVNQAMIHMYHDEYLTKTCNINILAQVHDSILLEVPRKIALDPMEWPRIVDKIYTYLSPTLSYNGVSFTIKNDMKMGYNWGEQTDTNKQGMRDVWAHSEVVKNFGSN
jgi:DNA polymerase I-like protein with 3'-5' exonuclease and polymerase domains